MLNPAGDPKHAGRDIGGCFERGVTHQCLAELKNNLERSSSYIDVILTRLPGETIEPLQHANFANRMQSNLYISIHFFHKPGKSELSLYHFLYHPSTDYWKRTNDTLTFIPYDQAHIMQSAQSRDSAMLMKNILAQSSYNSLLEVRNPIGIPFKPLIGINQPSIGIEISLATKDSWTPLIKPLTESILAIINTLACES